MIRCDDHHAADAESLIMMQISSNSDWKLITSTIQTFKYIFAIEEKIQEMMKEEMIADASLMMLRL